MNLLILFLCGAISIQTAIIIYLLFKAREAKSSFDVFTEAMVRIGENISVDINKTSRTIYDSSDRLDRVGKAIGQSFRSDR